MRKIRKDKGKKRKKYRGKPTRKYQRIKFPKKIGHKTHLKIWVWEKKVMSKSGRLRWASKLRPYVKPIIYKFGDRIDVPVEEIANKQLVENFAIEKIGYSGDFLVMSISKSFRNKKGFKWVKLFRVRITEHPEGLHANMYENCRLYRYWFWRKT